MVMSGGVAPVIQEPEAPQTTAMMDEEAPLTSVLTLGPSLPSQHWPLLAAALRPSALNPRESRLLVLTLAAETMFEFVVGALAAGELAGEELGEDEGAAPEPVAAGAPARASFVSLRELERAGEAFGRTYGDRLITEAIEELTQRAAMARAAESRMIIAMAVLIRVGL